MAWYRAGGGTPEEYTGATTVTPSVSQQVLQTAEKLVNSNITVDGDADLVAGNIRNGVDIFGVVGNVRKYGYASGNVWTGGEEWFSGGGYNLYTVSITGHGFTPACGKCDGGNNSTISWMNGSYFHAISMTAGRGENFSFKAFNSSLIKAGAWVSGQLGYAVGGYY